MNHTQNLGSKVKNLRKQKKLTLKQVSEKTGLSISFLSQLEHSKTSATLLSLKRISEALGVNPSYFFSSSMDNSRSAITRNIVDMANLTENRFIYKDLTGGMENPLFVPNLIILNPGDNRGNNFSHKGQEFLYVLEGTLTIEVDYEEAILQPYDCIFLDSSTPHNWYNYTDKPIKFLCISSRE
ncbi:MAG: helix-turn-helix domain-containing protein [Bacillota bacterium]|uniref:Helix-turn-helix transcriptional regulator n=1 Tax=Virgibacillus salarius TaxID=447199 RepID=A0A941DVU2_9BACI|nr:MULTISPECIES: XRE family transcriptional regulator [Bacillaceae]NAZ08760.1 cupin domain-containing protein [Agaribacter marinus]MBR7796049.1 helix-turn-helix transcriptional regulator [Virgibacillus salarius]MCC2252295.1 XRE family transcriptional regulator [Virgibacillus sp. AGTR]MDY7045253.1 XRE family transcriptional regulator [Virgibacillus sp. M23]QRZ18249.1 helix-turn-helix transcriptional regulator [Virgibacillus sp. AGTR]